MANTLIRQNFAIVVAMDEELGIGKAGSLPWRLKNDMKFFRELTTSGGSNVVVMGRKTWESIPAKFRPLPGRDNVVVSRTMEAGGDFYVDRSLEEGLTHVADQVFVIGGGEIYKQALELPQCVQLFITRVSGTYGCDTVFPRFEHKFKLDAVIEAGTEGGITYRIERWARTRSGFDLTDAG